MTNQTTPVVVLAPALAIPTSIVKTLTLRELAIKLIEYGKGAKPVTIVARTIPAVVAACPMRHDLCKYAHVNVFINVNYEKAVNRQLAREGKEADFVAGERKNKLVHVQDTPYLQHPVDGTLYLRCLMPKSVSYEYRTLDGTKVYSKDEITPFLRPKSSSKQGTEKEIMERDYTLSNIIAAHFDGEKYLIIPNSL